MKIESRWPHVGTVLRMNSLNCPDRLGWQDGKRQFTFREWNGRACRLANGLRNLGVTRGDRFAILSYNRGEWMDIYAGAAKGGQVAVPVMFRLSGPEIEYILNHSECKAFIVEEPFVSLVEDLRKKITVPEGAFIFLGEGPAPAGYISYESWLSQNPEEEPSDPTDAGDPWVFMYTSGTTGRPKAVVRTHEACMAHYFLDIANMGVHPDDKGMLVMPMCHVNSIHFSFRHTLVTGAVFVNSMVRFDAEELLRTIEKYKISFTSLVPTHYVMILGLPENIKNSIDVSSIRQLLISSAPARKELKLAIMDFFKGAKLWEGYGSTEAGMVTLLRPEDQLTKLGSIGKEIFGVDRILILDEDRNPVADGEVGELYFNTPMMFKEYWKDPEKTKEAFHKVKWASSGDMVRRDSDGYCYLVDRKANMIITGGENVYPSEVENVLTAHPEIAEAAVIGLPDPKWGETIKAVIILSEGAKPDSAIETDIIEFCKTRLASYKKPSSIEFIKADEMPRTATGKVLHRVLRERYGKWSDQ